MKKNTKNKPENTSPPTASASPLINQTPDQTQRNTHKLVLFRIITIVIVPILFFTSIELFLRMLGFGFDHNYLKSVKIKDQDVFVENQLFVRQFFGYGPARYPEPIVIPKQKATNEIRIFVFGESAAMGDPDPAFGFSRMLEKILSDQYTNLNFRIINTAITAINSHVILEEAMACKNLNADFWIIYMGNNEVIGPYGAGTVFGMQSPPYWFTRLIINLNKTRTAQLFQRTISLLRKKDYYPTEWQGMSMFVKNKISWTNPKLNTVHKNFEKNLRRIINTGLSSGAKIILCTPANNLKDCAPFASIHSHTFPTSKTTEFKDEFDSAKGLLETDQLLEAESKLLKLISIDPLYADTLYCLGIAKLKNNDPAKALKFFESARDFDALRFRPDSVILKIITETAFSLSNKVEFIDSNQLLAPECKGNIPGKEVLYEHVHLNFHGNYILAKNMAEIISKSLDSFNISKTKPWLTEEACSKKLGWSKWSLLQALNNIQKRMEQEPYTSQITHKSDVESLTQSIDSLKQYGKPANLRLTLEQIKSEMTNAPDDPRFYFIAANLAESLQDNRSAIQFWLKLIDILPHHSLAHYSLGKLFASEGDLTNAEKHLNQATLIRSDFAEAWNELGKVYGLKQNWQKAIASHHKALILNPSSLEIKFSYAIALKNAGKLTHAIKQFSDIVKIKPDWHEPWLSLGELMEQSGQLNYAEAYIAKAVSIMPADLNSRLCYSRVLEKLGKLNEAKSQIEAALKLNPLSWQAHVELAKLLIKSGEKISAIEHLRKALQINPGNEEIHKLLNVTLNSN